MLFIKSTSLYPLVLITVDPKKSGFNCPNIAPNWAPWAGVKVPFPTSAGRTAPTKTCVILKFCPISP